MAIENWDTLTIILQESNLQNVLEQIYKRTTKDSHIT